MSKHGHVADDMTMLRLSLVAPANFIVASRVPSRLVLCPASLHPFGTRMEYFLRSGFVQANKFGAFRATEGFSFQFRAQWRGLGHKMRLSRPLRGHLNLILCIRGLNSLGEFNFNVEAVHVADDMNRFDSYWSRLRTSSVLHVFFRDSCGTLHLCILSVPLRLLIIFFW